MEERTTLLVLQRRKMLNQTSLRRWSKVSHHPVASIVLGIHVLKLSDTLWTLIKFSLPWFPWKSVQYKPNYCTYIYIDHQQNMLKSISDTCTRTKYVVSHNELPKVFVPHLRCFSVLLQWDQTQKPTNPVTISQCNHPNNVCKLLYNQFD